MKTKYGTYLPRSARGVTLVEALAGTAIMGTLLAGILIARGRLAAQAGRAAMRVEACRAADDLLERWWPKRQEFPANDGGEIAGRPGWTWRTREVASESAKRMHVRVVALEIFGPQPGPEPAAGVEILLPAEDRDNEDTKRPDDN